MKKFFINTTEVNKEVMILNMVKCLSDKEPDNNILLRNDIYREVTKVVDEKALIPGNQTFELYFPYSFHMVEITEKGVK